MRNRLQILQNRAAKVVTSCSYDRRSVEILYELGWDNLEMRRTRQLPAIMFKLKNHITSDHLVQIFNRKTSMYSYNLRNSTHNLFLLRPCAEAEKKNSFHYRIACEQQTHFRSSLLSLRKRRERSDDRKCVCCSQANYRRAVRWNSLSNTVKGQTSLKSRKSIFLRGIPCLSKDE